MVMRDHTCRPTTRMSPPTTTTNQNAAYGRLIRPKPSTVILNTNACTATADGNNTIVRETVRSSEQLSSSSERRHVRSLRVAPKPSAKVRAQQCDTVMNTDPRQFAGMNSVRERASTIPQSNRRYRSINPETVHQCLGVLTPGEDNPRGYEFIGCRKAQSNGATPAEPDMRTCLSLPISNVILQELTVEELRQIHSVMLRSSGRGMKNTDLRTDIMQTPAVKAFEILLKPIASVEQNPVDDVEEECPDFPPNPPTESELTRIVNSWVERQNPDWVEEQGCAVCGTLNRAATMSDLVDVDDSLLDVLTTDATAEGPFTRRERLTKDDPIQAEKGPILDRACTKVCETCLTYLKRRKMPPAALANGNWTGDIPDELKGLNLFERLLICRVRPVLFVIRVHASLRGKMKGNVMCFHSPIKQIYDILPPPKSEIESIISYVHMGPTGPDEAMLRRVPLFVRRNKVKRALEWLKLNHRGYRDLEINERNLQSYDESRIPVHILFQATKSAGNRDEASTAVHDGAEEEGEEDGDCPFTVSGLTDDVMEDWENPTALKIAALRALHSGQPVLGVGRSEKPISTLSEPQVMTLAFPHLFPYGYGGFINTSERPTAMTEVSFESWARNKLLQHDKRFQMDETFIFYAFNYAQARAAWKSAFLTTRRKDFTEVARILPNLKPDVLTRVMEKAMCGKQHDVSDTEESNCVRILRLLQLSSRNIYGSPCSKRTMRKQLWSVVEQIGAPTWFITVSPPEHRSPICLYYADTNATVDYAIREPDEIRRLMAGNPAAAARYFHYIVSMLIEFVLGTSFSDGRGLFGPIQSYYGTVEQQGRLTLHIHMLVYMKNSLTPEQVRKRLAEKDTLFQDRLLRYLEETHRGDYMPETTSADYMDADVHEGERNFERQLPCPIPSQCETDCGKCVNCISNREWYEGFPSEVNDIVTKFNRHTCSPAACRKTATTSCKARFPRKLHPITTVGDDGYIEMKKTEEWINTFNPWLCYLVRCNTDVTSLLTGTAVKSIVAYVTDYVSKSDLRSTTMHECLKAVIRRYQLQGLNGDTSDEVQAKSLIMRILNRLTAQQEIGSPMAAMYLLGHPDHYTNVDFIPLYWNQYVQYVRKECELGMQPDIDNSRSDASDMDEEEDDDGNERGKGEFMEQKISLVRHKGRLAGYHTIDDYVCRPKELEHESLYTFTLKYQKCRRSGRKSDRERVAEDNKAAEDLLDAAVEDEEDSDEETIDRSDRRKRKRSRIWKDSRSQNERLSLFDRLMNRVENGRPQNISYEFVEGHVWRDRYLIHLRPTRHGRIYLAHFAHQLPRRDGSDPEYYYLAMLTLLRPWRTAGDLRQGHETWSHAFHSTAWNAECVRLMTNFNVLNECNDARDDYSLQRKNEDRRMREEINTGLENMMDVDCDVLEIRNQKAMGDTKQAAYVMDRMISLGMLNRLDTDGASQFERLDLRIIDKRKHIGDIEEATRRRLTEMTAPMNSAHSGNTFMPIPFDVRSLVYSEANAAANARDMDQVLKAHAAVVSKRFQLNEEQNRAYKLITDSTLHTSKVPLRMYLGGTGGTGKSQVINAVATFFNESGRGRRLAILAPTGTAASLIGGQTYHSFLGIRRKDSELDEKGIGIGSEKKAELTTRVKETEVIIFDEVSMIGCQELFKIAAKLAEMKENVDTPFGGAHVVFAGDFAQLPPVMSLPLYTKMIDLRVNKTNQEILIGRSIWEQVTTVVILRRNMRQKETEPEEVRFKEMLNNIRYKACTDRDIEFMNSLQPKAGGGTREVTEIMKRTCSIITSTNATRDAINECSAARFALETQQTLTCFVAVDEDCEKTNRRGGADQRNSCMSNRERELLLNLPPDYTNKIPGKLNLCIGMPVSLRKNDSTVLGITNGAEGHVVGWDAEDTAIPDRHILNTLYVKLTAPVKPFIIGNLPENVVPVVRRTEKITCCHLNGTERHVRRSQVPVILNFSMTCHAAQGKTRTVNIVSLKGMKTHTSVYTALSRGSSAAKTIIMDLPEGIHIITGGLRKNALKDELRELEILDELTKLKFSGLLKSEVQGVGRGDLILSFLEHHVPDLPYIDPAIAWTSKDQLEERQTDVEPFTVNPIPVRSRQSSKRRQDNFPPTSVNREANDVALPSVQRKSGSNTDGFEASPRLPWDSVNWSCAYDAVLQAMYSIWLDNRYALTRSEHLRQQFEAVERSEITIMDVRTTFRQHAYAHSPSTFPSGQRGTSVYEVAKLLFPEDNMSVRKRQWCRSCNWTIQYSMYLKGLSSMEQWEATSAYLLWTRQHGIRPNMNGWLWTVIQYPDRHEHSCAATDVVFESSIERTPYVFAIEIPLNNDRSPLIFPERQLMMNTNEGRIETFVLASITYCGQDHFAAYLLKHNGDAWFSDGQMNDGRPLHRGQHTLWDVSRMLTVYGSGMPAARIGNEKNACMLIYAVKQDDRRQTNLG